VRRLPGIRKEDGKATCAPIVRVRPTTRTGARAARDSDLGRSSRRVLIAVLQRRPRGAIDPMGVNDRPERLTKLRPSSWGAPRREGELCGCVPRAAKAFHAEKKPSWPSRLRDLSPRRAQLTERETWGISTAHRTRRPSLAKERAHGRVGDRGLRGVVACALENQRTERASRTPRLRGANDDQVFDDRPRAMGRERRSAW